MAGLRELDQARICQAELTKDAFAGPERPSQLSRFEYAIDLAILLGGDVGLQKRLRPLVPEGHGRALWRVGDRVFHGPGIRMRPHAPGAIGAVGSGTTPHGAVPLPVKLSAPVRTP